MNRNLKNILTNLRSDIDDQSLLQYINKELSEEEQYNLEMALNNDDFASEAIEGLKDIADKKDIAIISHQLNGRLKKQLEELKRNKHKRKLPSQEWTYYAIIIILITCIIGYFLVKQLAAGN